MISVSALDWRALEQQLDARGFAITEPLFEPPECDELAAMFDGDGFRSTIDMARHRFGDGRYRYFAHPLPEPIATARAAFYEQLAPIANRWAGLLSDDNPTFPATHAGLLVRCHTAGQSRPTPLLLRYRPGDWNALHQDLYGEVYFPFQVVTVLTRPGIDHQGGEFVLVEQRPRAQSRPYVLTPRQGEFVIFPTRERPGKGKNGYHRIGLRHGVSTVTGGERTALGIIFHDSK
jgi:uncharacterized protein